MDFTGTTPVAADVVVVCDDDLFVAATRTLASYLGGLYSPHRHAMA